MTAMAVLLAPGANGPRDHRTLVAIEAAMEEAAPGTVVERIELGGRAGPKVVAAVRSAAAALAKRADVPPDRVALGGRSFGGRMCSMAVAEGLPALGLVLVSYPLHAPGRPDQLRAGHFVEIGVPCLFVSGTRDAFATPAELEAATATIPGPVTHAWMEGGGHGLRGCDSEVASVVSRWVVGLRG
ncbi:MAG: alpha/beta hydrolase family protein [Acidimicrobiales bacterium]